MVPERNPVEEPDQLYKEFIVITGLNLLVNIVFHTFQNESERNLITGFSNTLINTVIKMALSN